MASIVKRGPNQWQVKIRRTSQPIVSKTFFSKPEAERWARKQEVKMDEGKHQAKRDNHNITFAELLTRYRDEITIHKKSKVSEINKIENLLKLPMFKKRIRNVTSSDIANYRDQRLKDVKGSTVIKDINLMGHCIDIAIKEWGVNLANNPVRRIRRPTVDKPRDRRLNSGEEKRLFDTIEKHSRLTWLRQIVIIAIETAMRRGEILNMQWHHVDFEKRTVHLPDTKNGETRDVPLSEKAIEILNEISKDKTPFIFPISPDSLKKAYQRVIKKSGIEGLRFHDLRHEATSRFFELGLNTMQVSAITGHKDLAMLKRYTHLRAEDLAKMI